MSERGQKWLENYFEGRAIGLNHRRSEDFAYWSGVNITGGQLIAALVFSFAVVGGGLFWFINLEPPAKPAAASSLGDAQLADAGVSTAAAPALSYSPSADVEPEYRAEATPNDAEPAVKVATQTGVSGQSANDFAPVTEAPRIEQEANGPAPIWARRPSFEEAQRYYPEDAQRRGVGGGAVLNCGLDVRGYLADCRVAQESPDGNGFGDAALRLSRRFVARPLPDGGRVTWRFDVPINFRASIEP